MAGLIGQLGYTPGRRKQAMVFLYHAGYQFQQIGELFGISKQRVHQVLGDAIDGGYRRAIATEREELVAQVVPLLRQGLTHAEVAEELELPLDDLNVLFASARKVRSRGRRPPWASALLEADKARRTSQRERRKSTRLTIALAIRASPLSLRAMAQKSGLSYSTIKALAQATGTSTWAPSPDALKKLTKALPSLKLLKT